MKYDELIAQVRQTATTFETNEQAESATRTVLTELGKRLGNNEASDLAAQLPPELKDILTDNSDNSGTVDDLDDFLRRVAEHKKAGTTPEEALDHAAAVFSTLAQFVSAGELDDLKSQLPASFSQLLRAD
ncbi:DUF2267 domain-containing protein [Brevibacterium aurantiacum]|uniref:DUF2267 domain-containing protein n=1 Tax=Brevibacterium aurantiacum TaxID=273384 RepID=A0A556C373_BREAU|nr:DUF2267 domain-containing protein [Brevibacterium aurantiacum]TSI11914.1 DUF2267 domain-containing protein [Brevibacterium aurantiacum]